ncbi:hypothetical protein THAOC_28935, partial [Thalassiosira oceanica]
GGGADGDGGDVGDAAPQGRPRPSRDGFPFMFGSRLNSMRDRPDLADGPVLTPRDLVRRQAKARGLDCVDFNYPQHFDGHWSAEEARDCLEGHGLVAGAVCLRYPPRFARGAMNHPDPEMRREAIEMTMAAADAARVLGCDEVVVWSAYDGYDYPFQVDYDEKWEQLVEAFRECCDAYPDIRWSLEYKPTDENTRYFTVPSTGAAVLLVRDVDRTNFGLTLDVGHMLMSGENPGQSIAMAGRHLFGVQLNDGHTRLAAEDGLVFGSVHPGMALEVMWRLRRVGFVGHFYFDTFPQRSDPVAEAELNVRRARMFWDAAEGLDRGEVERIAAEHDAMAALDLVDNSICPVNLSIVLKVESSLHAACTWGASGPAVHVMLDACPGAAERKDFPLEPAPPLRVLLGGVCRHRRGTPEGVPPGGMAEEPPGKRDRRHRPEAEPPQQEGGVALLEGNDGEAPEEEEGGGAEQGRVGGGGRQPGVAGCNGEIEPVEKRDIGTGGTRDYYPERPIRPLRETLDRFVPLAEVFSDCCIG